jgi:ribosomal-protein-alanine N-acetyltransferase
MRTPRSTVRVGINGCCCRDELLSGKLAATMMTLTTARLELRPVTADDLDPLAGLYADPAVMRFISTGVPLTRAHAELRLRVMLAHWADHGFGVMTVRDRADGTFVGRCGLSYLGDTGCVELGYLFTPPVWGRGYATEVGRVLLDHGFGTLKLRQIIAIARPANAASRRVLEKLGMRYVRMAEWDGGPVAWYEITIRDASETRDASPKRR